MTNRVIFAELLKHFICGVISLVTFLLNSVVLYNIRPTNLLKLIGIHFGSIVRKNKAYDIILWPFEIRNILLAWDGYFKVKFEN